MKILETRNGFYNLACIGSVHVVPEQEGDKWQVRLYLGSACVDLLGFELELDALKFQLAVLAEIRHFMWGDGSWRVLKEVVGECMEKSLLPVFGEDS